MLTSNTSSSPIFLSHYYQCPPLLATCRSLPHYCQYVLHYCQYSLHYCQHSLRCRQYSLHYCQYAALCVPLLLSPLFPKRSLPKGGMNI
eukprot:g15201.t1